MKIGNWAHEQAIQRADQERDAGVAKVRAALAEEGSFDCVSCGDEIDEQRRSAMPSARRCLECQEKLERAMHSKRGI